MQLVSHFGGECLSDKKLSIVKGAEAYKFKCTNGHIFYKFVTELQSMSKLQPIDRRLSKVTKASTSSCSVSSDEDTFDPSKSQDNIWCPKCESFYKGAEIIAKKNGFKLSGEIYMDNLVFTCLKNDHKTSIS